MTAEIFDPRAGANGGFAPVAGLTEALGEFNGVVPPRFARGDEEPSCRRAWALAPGSRASASTRQAVRSFRTSCSGDVRTGSFSAASS